jgi:deoxyhypusine synthase
MKISKQLISHGKVGCAIRHQMLESKASLLKTYMADGVTKRPITLPVIKGPDFNKGNDLNDIVGGYYHIGSQAYMLGKAVKEVNRMLNWRLSDDPVQPDDEVQDLEERKHVKATVYLGYASNVTTSGLREIIRYLAQHKLVDAVFTTAGGIEEDFMKCFEDFYLGEFDMKGTDMLKRGIYRTGNLVNTATSYIKFFDWYYKVLEGMLEEQKTQGTLWTPSSMINRMGREINDERSIYYWCWKNDIPVFNPAIVDGAIGENLLLFNLEKPGLKLDLMQDQRRLYSVSLSSIKTGAVIIGGSISKHQILNSNIPRQGLNYSVYINTGQEFDSSDGGARPDEAVCWNKINRNATPVKVHADASLVFPLLVSQTFVPYHEKRMQRTNDRPTS